MTIRQPHPNEIPNMVQLLKESLGENLIKKSVEVWNYKHVKNPFGPSHVLLAEKEEQLIGLRAFMSWKWQQGDKAWQAWRAVDTATHPNHQGKGIFKTLTLQALDEVAQKEPCFIFNTPNEKSRPGYLKMGWKALGKLKIALVPFIVYVVHALLNSSKYRKPINDLDLAEVCHKDNLIKAATQKLFTPKSVDYLHWRYRDNPMQRYTITTGEGWYVAAYVKKHKYFSELRLAEVLGSDSRANKKQIKRQMAALALQLRCLFITTTQQNLFSLRYYGDIGPLLTSKDLSKNQEIIHFNSGTEQWLYEMGDLELF
jgi:GNAT superfamily N-acetyltransferase